MRNPDKKINAMITNATCIILYLLIECDTGIVSKKPESTFREKGLGEAKASPPENESPTLAPSRDFRDAFATILTKNGVPCESVG
jgi:hypothetical protein